MDCVEWKITKILLAGINTDQIAYANFIRAHNSELTGNEKTKWKLGAENGKMHAIRGWRGVGRGFRSWCGRDTQQNTAESVTALGSGHRPYTGLKCTACESTSDLIVSGPSREMDSVQKHTTSRTNFRSTYETWLHNNNQRACGEFLHSFISYMRGLEFSFPRLLQANLGINI
jgi:hypothetical protein